MGPRRREQQTAADLDSLARELLRAAAGRSETGRGVVLDIELEGVRCVLVRRRAPAAPLEVPLLSPREREIARMVAQGLPNKTIAAVLEISTWTVGTHLRRMFAKLGVTSRAAMVAKLGS
jgi:DNA-binding CsgD family transcriptional regulator